MGSVVITGLSAGVFYAWSVSVIPGTQRVTDSVYLETMQSINRAILNPAFFLVFFGSMLFLGTSGALAFSANKVAFALLLAAALTYLFGVIGVTGLGNVPLNDQLDALNLASMTADQQALFRRSYEFKWNRLHQIRTALAVLTFLLTVIALFVQTSKHA